jgi:hypothetical protein
VANKYEPLTDVLRAAAARGQSSIEFGFDEIARLVGELPPSSGQRQWWANNSLVQALAWRAADFHVEQVYLDRRRVRFARGRVGGSYAAAGRKVTPPTPPTRAVPVTREPVDAPVDVRVRLQWCDAGEVYLDAREKPVFGTLEEAPGLYRMTLTGGVTGARTRIYIGETDNLRRRLSANYRSPGPRQQTSLRINGLLREQLLANGRVSVAVATAATIWLDGVEQPLDLQRKAGRLLAENAALVLQQVKDDADIVNLG